MIDSAYGHFAEGRSIIREILNIILNPGFSERGVVMETYGMLYEKISFEDMDRLLTDDEDRRKVRINLNFAKDFVSIWRNKTPIITTDTYKNIQMAITLHSLLSFLEAIKCIHDVLSEEEID